MIDPLLEGALIVRDALRAASEAHLLAEIVPSFPADVALQTRNADLECHPVSKSEAIDPRADGNNLSRRLMAKRQWVAGTKITIGKLLVV
jgi:hypothetical protein